MIPIRIQRKRTKGWKMPANTVYVGRPTKWGNPYNKNLYRIMLEKEQYNLYEVWLKAVAKLEFIKQELSGKNLACWCRLNEKCHADVLLQIANG